MFSLNVATTAVKKKIDNYVSKMRYCRAPECWQVHFV